MAFWRKCKNASKKQEIASDAVFKAWPFSSTFNFARKNSQVNSATCKYYCLFFCGSLFNLTITKLQRAPSEFLDMSLKTWAFTKTSQISRENQSFSLLFRNVAIFIESHCIFLCYLLQYDVF